MPVGSPLGSCSASSIGALVGIELGKLEGAAPTASTATKPKSNRMRNILILILQCLFICGVDHAISGDDSRVPQTMFNVLNYEEMALSNTYLSILRQFERQFIFTPIV
jgi:hypothetical protein